MVTNHFARLVTLSPRDICDRLTVLDQGRVLDCGSVAEIQSSHKVQEVYLRRA